MPFQPVPRLGKPKKMIDMEALDCQNLSASTQKEGVMPSLLEKKETEQEPLVPQKASLEPQTGSRAALRKSLRGVGYEEGAKALSVQGSDKPEVQGPQSYEAILGKLLGGKLYEIVVKNTSPDKLQGYAIKAVDALIKAAVDQVGKAEGLDAEGKKATSALIEVLGQVLQEQVDQYLGSPEGQALLQKISAYAAGHPKEVIGAVILAAAACVAANVTIPEIAARANLAEGLSAEVKAKLGKVREIVAETVSAKVQYEAGRFKAEADVTYEKEKGTTGSVKASYGDESGAISTVATVDKEGLLSAELGGKLKQGYFSGSGGAQWSREGGTSAKALLEFADGQRRYLADARYDFTKDLLNVRLSQEVKEGLLTARSTISYEDGKVSAEEARRYGTDKNYIEAIKRTGPDGKEGVTVTGAVTKGPMEVSGTLDKSGAGDVNASLKAKYTAKDLRVALDATFGKQATASVEAHPKEGMVIKGEATYSFRDAKFLSYAASFGFKDPEEFKSFLIEYKRNNVPEIPEDKFFAMVEFTIGQMMARVQDETTLKGGKLSTGEASAHLAYPLSKDVMLIGGVTAGYGPEKNVGVRPEIGVQIRKVPVLVGYDINSKTWSIRLTIPFGR